MKPHQQWKAEFQEATTHLVGALIYPNWVDEAYVGLRLCTSDTGMNEHRYYVSNRLDVESAFAFPHFLHHVDGASLNRLMLELSPINPAIVAMLDEWKRLLGGSHARFKIYCQSVEQNPLHNTLNTTNNPLSIAGFVQCKLFRFQCAIDEVASIVQMLVGAECGCSRAHFNLRGPFTAEEVADVVEVSGIGFDLTAYMPSLASLLTSTLHTDAKATGEGQAPYGEYRARL